MAQSTVLKKITAEAKKIRKQHPSMQWKNAVKQAGAKYRSGSLSKKSAPKKKTGVKKTLHYQGVIKKKTGNEYAYKLSGIGSLSTAQLKAEAGRRIKDKIGVLLLQKHMATTKREKARLQKEIAAHTREYKKYCK